MMRKRKEKNFDIMQILLKAFKDCPIGVKSLAVIIAGVCSIVQFFSATNKYEIFLSIICVIIMVILLYLKGREWRFLRVAFAAVLLLNVFMTPICGAPFGGALSDENIQKYKLNKFHENFAQALYEMSIADYDDALRRFKRIENNVPEEYRLEFYLWYGETAMFAGKTDLSIELLNRMEKEDVAHSKEQKKVVFNYMPICKMVNYLNEENFEELKIISKQYQSTREQIFVLFELVAWCLEDNIIDNRVRIEELLVNYLDYSDNIECFSEIKNYLLFLSAGCLAEYYPEYASILLAQLYSESKSFIYENIFFVYPENNNFMNIRWTSMKPISKLRKICENGWRILQETEKRAFKECLEEVEQLGLYLGSEEIIKKRAHIKEINKHGYENFELYNVLPLDDKEFIGVYIETLSGESHVVNDYQIAREAHICLFKSNETELVVTPVKIDGQELMEYILMNKLFLIEPTKEENIFMVESIVGTGEYLKIDVLDFDENTYKTVENIQEIYHASDLKFDGKDSFCVNFEIANEVEANKTKKVGGRINAKVDNTGKWTDESIEYWDPALEFYAEERNDELIFPLVNLDNLNGKEIRSKVLLEKIRENSIPYYKYSLIQMAYENFMEIAGCNLSGITIVYDAETQEEAQFFYYVERRGDDIQLLGIYEIVNDSLQSVY